MYFFEIYWRFTFENPVGLPTEGSTWLLQVPSHLLTATSPLHVLWSLPNSSYSSETFRKLVRCFGGVYHSLPLIRWISEGSVSQLSSRVMSGTERVRETNEITIKKQNNRASAMVISNWSVLCKFLVFYTRPLGMQYWYNQHESYIALTAVINWFK